MARPIVHAAVLAFAAALCLSGSACGLNPGDAASTLADGGDAGHAANGAIDGWEHVVRPDGGPGQGFVDHVSGSGPMDVWFVGEGSAVSRWTEAGAWDMDAGTAALPSVKTAVWAASPTDAWVAGYGVGKQLVHWSGGVFTPSTIGGVVAFSGTGANDVWAVGSSLSHWDGHAWTRQPMASTFQGRSIWAVNASDVWVVGDGGEVFHFDGVAWSRVATPATDTLWGVWASAADDVWVVGTKVMHWDGRSWTDVQVPALPKQLGGSSAFRAVTGNGPSDVWVGSNLGVLHWDGATWTADPGRWCNSLWADGQGTVWLAAGSPNGLWRHR